MDDLHVNVEFDMRCIACIKRLEISGMTWLLVKDDLDILHVEIEYMCSGD